MFIALVFLQQNIIAPYVIYVFMFLIFHLLIYFIYI